MASVPFPELGLAMRAREAGGLRFIAPRMTELLGCILFNAAEHAWAKALDRIHFEGVLEDGKVQVLLYVDLKRIGLVRQDDDREVRFHPAA